jgi:hypothetical protein
MSIDKVFDFYVFWYMLSVYDLQKNPPHQAEKCYTIELKSEDESLLGGESRKVL